VRRVDIGEYPQSLRLRLLIEPEAAALAVRNIPRRRLIEVRREIHDLVDATAYHTDARRFSDDNLHNMIIDYCGNAVMAEVLRELARHHPPLRDRQADRPTEAGLDRAPRHHRGHRTWRSRRHPCHSRHAFRKPDLVHA
jgi:DNA-binding GntR family transcriptional regulator